MNNALNRSKTSDFSTSTTITANGKKWNIDFKWFANRKLIRVYKVYGDITATDDLNEALQNFAIEMGADKLESWQ